MRVAFRILPLAVCTALLFPGYAAARQVSGLDRAYGTGGFARTPLGVAGEEPDVELTVAPDGSAVVANGVEGIAVGFDGKGRRDKAFGGAGRLTVRPFSAIGGPGKRFVPRLITADRRGRIVAFGERYEPAGAVIRPGQLPVFPGHAMVLRFRADGELDPTFGGGKGYVVGDFGLPPEPSTGVPAAGVMAGVVDSRDRPLFIAGSTAPVGGCLGHGSTALVPGALVRLTQAGSPDPSFGAGDGISALEGSGQFPTLAVDTADQPVVAVGRTGSFAAACGRGTKVYRFDDDGRPMSGFGVGGIREFKSVHLGAVGNSGTLILSERLGRALKLIEVGPSGTPVPGFGERGVVRVNLPIQVGIHLEPVGFDAKGRLLLAGFVGSPASEPERGQPRSAFLVGRLLADGKIDRSFGEGGWLIDKLPDPLELISLQARFDPRGGLLLAGIETAPHRLDGAFVVARYVLGR